MSINPQPHDTLALVPEPDSHLRLVENPTEPLVQVPTEERKANVRKLLFGEEFAANGEPQAAKPSSNSVPEWNSSPDNLQQTPTLSWETSMVEDATRETEERLLSSSPSVLATSEQNKDILDLFRISKPARWLAVLATSAACGTAGAVGLSNNLSGNPNSGATIEIEQLKDPTQSTEATLTINHSTP